MVSLVLRFFSLKVPRMFLNNLLYYHIKLNRYKHTKIGVVVMKGAQVVTIAAAISLGYLLLV